MADHIMVLFYKDGVTGWYETLQISFNDTLQESIDAQVTTRPSLSYNSDIRGAMIPDSIYQELQLILSKFVK